MTLPERAPIPEEELDQERVESSEDQRERFIQEIGRQTREYLENPDNPAEQKEELAKSFLGEATYKDLEALKPEEIGKVMERLYTEDAQEAERLREEIGDLEEAGVRTKEYREKQRRLRELDHSLDNFYAAFYEVVTPKVASPLKQVNRLRERIQKVYEEGLRDGLLIK